MRRASIILVVLAALGGLVYFATRSDEPRDDAALLREPRELELPPRLEVLYLGAVADPGAAQVQIEQDLELARLVFEGPAYTLFGGGPGVPFVHELGVDEQTSGARLALAELFSKRSVSLSYRAPRIHVDGPGSMAAFDLVLGHARTTSPALPLLYVAGHGERGEVPSEAYITLWGDVPFTPADLAAWLAESRSSEPLRLVATTCYSGAFAEIVFDEADESLGPARDVHCGLFSTTAEDEASGCDPDPDRARQEGFGIHFLNAMRGLDRHGAQLERADLDGDGHVSLLEAHAHARVASASIGVPTLTSERFLRYTVAGEPEGIAPGEDPIEAFVIESLGAALDLPSRRAAEERLDALSDAFDLQTEELADAGARSDEAFLRLRTALLEIVPFVDDPWNPRWEAEIRAREDELMAVLERSDEAEALRVAVVIEESIERELVRLQATIARARRLVRAYENLALLGALESRGGEELDRYQAVRECERFTPRLGRP